MIDYDQMRKNMVECQLQTNGITADEILKAFGAVPRERFLPPQLQGVAYIDEDIRLPTGGFMPEPLVLAKMLAALEPAGADVALCIGDATGYGAAILSQLVTTVVTLESRAGQLDQARRTWADIDMCNIAIARGSGSKGCGPHAPYEVILICGAIEFVPEDLLRQLSPGGRLAAVIRAAGLPGPGKIHLFEKDGKGECHAGQPLADASTPFLDDFRVEPAFVF
jgi:protein-L-isoaspartate(D-aspartate) O-methyltransferase